MSQSRDRLAAAYAGIELGGTKSLCRLIAAGGEVLADERFATTAPTQLLGELGGCIEGALRGRALGAIGVASFGPIVVDPGSPGYGRVLATPKPGWSGFDVRRGLVERFSAPVVVETDVNAAALAEQASGAGRGHACVAYLTVGTGIGAGLAVAGTALRGALHPEAGHMRLRRRAGDEFTSTCPFHDDCAEGLAAGPAIARRLGAGRALGEDPQVLRLAAGYLGELVANLVLAWSPHRLVLGGGVMQVAALRVHMRQAMDQALNGYGPAVMMDADMLVPAQLEHSGLEGALMLARGAGRGTS